MQNDQIYSDIINSLKTKDDLLVLQSQVNLLEESLYDQKIKLNLTPSLLSALKVEKKEDLIKNLKEKLAKIKILEVTLASKMPIEIFQELISQNIVLDITIDESIMGGACFAFNGKYFDGSLRKSFEGVLKKNL